MNKISVTHALPHRQLLKKAWFMIRLIAFFITAALLQVSARSMAQKITLSARHANLETLFNEIRQQSDYHFIYTDELLQQAKPVSIQVREASLDAVLQQIFRDQPISYIIDKKTVVVQQKGMMDKVKEFFTEDSAKSEAAQQFIIVTGRVIDSLRMPIAGATIRVVKGKSSISSGANGAFTLSNVDPDATLQITAMGYIPREVQAAERLGSVVLSVSQSPLDEVQVIAYGTTTRRLSTGDISTVTSKDIETQPVSNVLLALQGRISGMQITPGSAVPGSAPNVRIRGIGSIAAGYSPLFILDGVPVTEKMSSIVSNVTDNGQLSLLLGINPSEIERVDVLKDADATSIYGSRGANGVVLITTKRGGKDGLKVNVNANTGIQKVANFVDMMDVHQYNAMRREAMMNDGIVPTAANAPDLFTWDSTQVHDWQREFLGGTGVNQDVNLSLSGGNRNTQFYINAGYHKEGTVTPSNSDFNRKSFRANVTHTSSDKKFTLAVISNYSISELNLPTNSMASFIDLPPDYPLNNQDGTPNFTSARGYPYASLLQTYTDPSRLYGSNLNLGYEVIKGLRMSVNAGFNIITSEQSYKQPLISLNPASYTSGQLRINNNTANTWIIEPQTEYTRTYQQHHFKLLAGGTFQRATSSNLAATGTNYLDDALLGSIAAAGTKTLSTSSSMYSYASFFSRLTYDYDQKYLVNVSFRRDGSSRFGPGKRFGNFAAAGLGWIFTQEPALKNALSFLSFGKLRGSYGISGNDQIADYGYLSTYSNLTSPTLMYDGLTVRAARLANPDYRWEETRKLEAALELGFVKDRIMLTTSFFRNRSGNQLISYSLGPQAGFSSYQANFPAVVQNRGVEMDITSRNLVNGAFKWNSTLTLSQSKNVLLKYDNIEKSSYYSIYVVGRSLSLLQTYTYLGLDDTGVPLLEDKNHSNSINWEDAIPNQDNNPLFGGLSNELSWKGIGLSFFLQYSRNTTFSNLVPLSFVGAQGTNQTVMLLDRWQKPGDEKTTDIPRFTTRSSTYQTLYFSQADIWLTTSNVVRLSNAALSYEIPKSILQKVKMSRCQLYVNGQNLFVFDKYKKYRMDPSTGNGALPPLRTFVFGINSSF